MNKAAQIAIAKGATTFVFGSAIAATLSWGFATDGVGTKRDPKPVNEPTFETHGEAARQLCKVETGDDSLIRSSDLVLSKNVVVVRLNGRMVRMPTDEVFERSQSKTSADNVWVVGICESEAFVMTQEMRDELDAYAAQR